MEILPLCCFLSFCLRVAASAKEEEEENKFWRYDRFKCENSGNYSVSGSCSAYIICEDDSQDTFKLVHAACGPGLSFSPQIHRCIDERLVKDCSTSRGSYELQASQTHLFDKYCSTTPNQYICVNCKTLVNCIKGKAYPRFCDPGDFCLSRNEAFGGSVCYPGSPRDCLCSENNSFYQDPYSTSSFFMCDDDGRVSIHHCPESQIFDKEQLACHSKSGLPTCTGPGTFVLADDCRRYYSCVETINGWLQRELWCPTERGVPLMFNEVSGKCESPCGWKVSMAYKCFKNDPWYPLWCVRRYMCKWDVLTILLHILGFVKCT